MAYQEVMNGDIRLRNTKAALAATTACFVTDCKGWHDSLVTNVSAGLDADDRNEAMCVRQIMTTNQYTMRWERSAMPADGLTKSWGTGDRFRILPSSRQRNAWKPGRETFWMTVLCETMSIYSTKAPVTL